MRWKAANLNFVGFYLFATTNIKSTTVTNSHATSTLGRWWRWHDGPVSRSVGCFRFWGISFFFLFFYPKRDPDLQLLLLHVSHFLIQYVSTLTAGRKCLLRSFSTETHAAAAATVQLYIAADRKSYHPLCDSLSAMTCLVMPLFLFFLCPGQKWFKPLSVVLAGKQLTHTARVMVANRNCYISLLSWSQNIKRLNLNGETDMCRSNPGLLRSDSNVHHSFLFMSQTFGKQWIYSLPVRE